jgi:hypothetical protein
LMLVTRGDGQRAKRRSWFRRKPKDGAIVSGAKRGQPAE